MGSTGWGCGGLVSFPGLRRAALGRAGAPPAPRAGRWTPVVRSRVCVGARRGGGGWGRPDSEPSASRSRQGTARRRREATRGRVWMRREASWGPYLPSPGSLRVGTVVCRRFGEKHARGGGPPWRGPPRALRGNPGCRARGSERARPEIIRADRRLIPVVLPSCSALASSPAPSPAQQGQHPNFSPQECGGRKETG